MEAQTKLIEKLKELLENIELQNSIEDPATEAEIFRLELLAKDAIKLRREIASLDKQIAEGKEIPAGAEEIINKIYDKIREDLIHAKLTYWIGSDDERLPLVDHLTTTGDISVGIAEIDSLIEQIEIEDLVKEAMQSNNLKSKSNGMD